MSFEEDLENYLKDDHFQEAAQLIEKNLDGLESVIKEKPHILLHRSNNTNDYFIHFLIRDFRKKDLVIKIIELYRINNKLDVIGLILNKKNQDGENALKYSGELYHLIVSVIGDSLITTPNNCPARPTTSTTNNRHFVNSHG